MALFTGAFFVALLENIKNVSIRQNSNSSPSNVPANII